MKPDFLGQTRPASFRSLSGGWWFRRRFKKSLANCPTVSGYVRDCAQIHVAQASWSVPYLQHGNSRDRSAFEAAYAG